MCYRPGDPTFIIVRVQLQHGLSLRTYKGRPTRFAWAPRTRYKAEKPDRGAFGQDIDLVGALGAVFAKWLPDDYVDMNALQPLLDKYDAAKGCGSRLVKHCESGPRPPKVEKIDAKAVILKMFGGGAGQDLGAGQAASGL